jgi:hypothetical protein
MSVKDIEPDKIKIAMTENKIGMKVRINLKQYLKAPNREYLLSDAYPESNIPKQEKEKIAKNSNAFASDFTGIKDIERGIKAQRKRTEENTKTGAIKNNNLSEELGIIFSLNNDFNDFATQVVKKEFFELL